MLDRQKELFGVSEESVNSDTSFLLSELEVYNWGPFRGLHRAEFDSAGTAIIGPTGSGKTTLVDALMTLLVQQPRYNLASTGGHESDRTLISYVRGVLGGDASDGREEIARPGKTKTGICATYRSHDQAQTLRLAGLLWTDGPSNAADDLKRRWFFSSAADQTLETWLRALHDDGSRELARLSRETAGLQIFESKTAYLARTRKFFSVGENAFTLLNRAAGLKQLNSIDEIFRDLVLDDHSAFERALQVAGEFDNLTAIHAELETARRQLESLMPVADEHQKLLSAKCKAERLQVLKQILPTWFAIVAEQRWSNELERISAERNQQQAAVSFIVEEEKNRRSQVDTLRECYLALGGNVIGELEKTISVQRERVAEKSKNAADYRRWIGQFQLSGELTAEALNYNQTLLVEKREHVEKLRKASQEETLSALSQLRDQARLKNDIESAVRKVKERPGSNIPPRFQDFRAELSAQLDLPESDLPFLAELIEVKTDQSAWRGAIERAIGSDRLRILVPNPQLAAALSWVNHRNNELHVRLQRAQLNEEPVRFLPDGYVQKLNFKNHPLLGSAQRLLATRDLHCVASANALQTTEHALTVEGMMSGRLGRFEKQDQRRLDQDWMTGFDNKDQLEVLARQLNTAGKNVSTLTVETEKRKVLLAKLTDQLTLIDQLIKIEFATIDLPGAESELARSLERLDSLLDPQSDASRAKQIYEVARKELETLHNQVQASAAAIAVLNNQWSRADDERKRAAERARRGLSAEEVKLAENNLVIPADVEPNRLGDEERDLRDRVDNRLQEQHGRVTEIEQRLVRFMGLALRADTGALSDVGSDIQDVPAYLERLRVLKEEALPEKRKRFLEYLNRSSDQGVTQLLAGIKEEVDAIEQRLEDLNKTLAKVDFRSGRYLQLQPQHVKDERLRALDSAMRKVSSAALKDDEGECHYQALQEMIGILRDAADNRRQLGSRALLDPRFRLQFFVVEVTRQTGSRSPPRTGSQSGSGGEKELMASHILTASLSYALCPPEADRPLYATVVLDEAFSKSSPSAANRIIEALRVFRLHPIFVTPNKEIGLLKEHTRKVICVQRQGKEASLASISWHKLEEMARQQ
jgi:uncharacterized protein YPO0396